MSKNKSGFTIVELLVAIPIVILVISVIIFATISLTGHSINDNTKNIAASDLQTALDIIEQDITLSNRFLSTNEFDLDPSQQNAGQNFSNINTNGHPALILKSILTTTNPLSNNDTKKIVHDKFGANVNCAMNAPYYINVVYFVENNTLYRRLLFPRKYAFEVCEAPWQKPTCKNPSGFCVNEDMKLAENVSMKIKYIAPGENKEIKEANDASLNNFDRQSMLDLAQTIDLQLTASVQYNKGEKPEIITRNLYATIIP